MEDHGEILTRIERIFGKEIDHEVIKMVLQACNWNSQMAIENLSNLCPKQNEITSKSESRSTSHNSGEIKYSYAKNFPELPAAVDTDQQYESVCQSVSNLKLIPKGDAAESRLLTENTDILDNNDCQRGETVIENISETDNIKSIIADDTKKILIIMRGLPGSGKSTLAQSLKGTSGVVLSTDDFFCDKSGKYIYNSSKLSEAHNWNKQRAKVMLSKGVTPVIIDNTNLQRWEFQPYIKYAMAAGYLVELLEPETAWKYNSKELAKRTTHSIPKKKIDEMKDRFERGLTIKSFLKNRPNFYSENNDDGNNVSGSTTGSESNGGENKRDNEITDDTSNVIVEENLSIRSQPDNEDKCKNLIDKKLNFCIEEVKKILDLHSEILEKQKSAEVGGDAECLQQKESCSEDAEGTETDEKVNKKLFKEIVENLGHTVKEALHKKSNNYEMQIAESYGEDVAMYELLSTMKDNKATPLSSLQTDSLIAEESEICAVQDEQWIGLPISSRSVAEDSVNNSTVNSRDHEKKLKKNSIHQWRCLDAESVIEDWNTTDSGKDVSVPYEDKQSKKREQKRNGDPHKWINENYSQIDEDNSDCIIEIWKAGSNIQSWSDCDDTGNEQNFVGANVNSMVKHTGAVPKHNRSEQAAPVHRENSQVECSTQVNSFDFMILKDGKADSDSITVLTGDGSRFIPGIPPVTDENGPLTKSKLQLHKSSMTEESDILRKTDGHAVSKMKSLFPTISKVDLRDILIKCHQDIDWAVNLLIDGGYEMAESVNTDFKTEESSDSDIEGTLSSETSERNDEDQSCYADHSDISDISPVGVHKRVKQSSELQCLQLKQSLESAIVLNSAADDIARRLTGKDYLEVNVNKVKLQKDLGENYFFVPAPTVRKDSSRSESESDGDNNTEGAQYLTLEIDPLFASQLINIFGPVSSMGMATDFTEEDRRTVLPLELCHQIHKYWSGTLEGNFQNETEILDRFIREDEELARKLQEEENESNAKENMTDAFHKDPPKSFQEIVDLEQALQLSNTRSSSETTYSQVINLQKLQNEFAHIDQNVIDRIFTESNYNYTDTRHVLNFQYGSSRNTVKNVFASGKEVIMKEETERTKDNEECSEELLAVDDPQAYRDEAQLYYMERKKAFEKANEASRKGLRTVAAYYAQIGNKYAIKFKEANERASKMILTAVNANKDANTLDLHLLHVPEALRETQSFLSERKSILSNRKLKQLQVLIITGRGTHSVGGEARLKPAIKHFLQAEGYSFEEVHAGMLRITLKH